MLGLDVRHLSAYGWHLWLLVADPRSFGAKNFDLAASFKICNAVELDVQKGWGHAFACG